jgi:hypothetical protein
MAMESSLRFIDLVTHSHHWNRINRPQPPIAGKIATVEDALNSTFQILEQIRPPVYDGSINVSSF